jgi:prolyl-tRNA synthetase
MVEKADEKAITPKEADYSEWYQDIVLKAELADYSPVKGCMVIRPHGYRIWEKMHDALDAMFRATGHKNAYFPLFIPLSFLSKEAEHVEGFAKECAVVTHHRLGAKEGGGVEPTADSRLEEPLVVRPTSETIMYSMYSKWIKSYRDLPLLLNQWANIVRWEMRTRLFLRTTEFLWQEGHTAHATHEESWGEVIKMLDIYARFSEEWMAVPVYKGVKSESEKFAGALKTTCIEALMQDGKALQAGTSHDLGQNFAKAFNVKFQTEKSDWEYCWQTSWGVSTRLIGALVMAHSDNKGLVLPPKLAPIQVVIIPIYRDPAQKETILSKSNEICRALAARGFEVHLDDRDKLSPGFKYNEWELKGVPLRIELGPKDLEKGECQGVTRVSMDGGKEGERVPRIPIPLGSVCEKVEEILNDFQNALYVRAMKFRDSMTFEASSYEDFKTKLEGGGFFWADWCGSAECEAKVKEETKATIRLVPFEEETLGDKCFVCGEKSKTKALWARAY